MNLRHAALLVPLLAALPCPGQTARGSMAFTVSMPDPASHRFHVTLRCDGLEGELQDFKLPVWTPGYYRVIDYARSVSDFRAQDGAGRPLAVEKVARNAWRVVAANSPTVVLNYDVTGTVAFAAQNFLGEKRAYITPPALFVHLAGQLNRPVTVIVQPPPNWSRVSTGLDPVEGRQNTFSAPDFDVLYDCPILMGTQEVLQFEVSSKPHRVVIENVPESVDRARMVRDLKRMVEAATQLIGDVPYRHYTFLMMGSGNGGIEHLNSASIAFNGNSLTNENGYRGWLSYVAHEYFHNFNVKRIRPIALGPFDYDVENLTAMLWVSEGLSVYYQDIVMVRAGLMTREQYLEKLQNSIARFENAPGRRYQSATDSSWNTWGTSGVGGDRNTTISYYDNGAMLGALLDLKIRTESRNERSLDDVMRALYRKFYQAKKRGFTDAEFRQECETAAGASLSEVFEYASTTREMDYGKYFNYAGLGFETASQDAPGAFLGADLQTRDGKLFVADVVAGSPAQAAGLESGDQILEFEGAAAAPKALNDLLSARKAGDAISVKISRANSTRELKAVLAKNNKRSFTIKPVAAPGDLADAILKDWLRTAL